MSLSLRISDDEMSATLFVPAKEKLGIKNVQAMILRSTVSFGIIKEAIMKAIAVSEEDREIIVAKGKRAKDGKPGKLTPTIPSEEMPLFVEEDQVIGEYSCNQDPEDGFFVTGMKIPAKNIEKPFGIENSFLINEDGKLRALCKGFFFINEKGNFELSEFGLKKEIEDSDFIVSEGSKSLTLKISHGYHFDIEDIKNYVIEKKVVYGFHKEKIINFITAEKTSREIIIAKALLPVEGKDASIKVEIDTALHFEEDSTGIIDYHNFNSVTEVKKDQLLAKKVLPQEGTKGIDIYGGDILPQEVKDIALSEFAGEGTVVNPSNKDEIIADISGVFFNDDSKVSAIPLLVIDGDVDLRTGNIETDYAVLIKGDIKEGFSVKSGADITVEGAVEDARVSARGNIEVKQGILKGKNRIKAHQSLVAVFVQDREIKAESIMVRENLRNSVLYISKNIKAKRISGGKVFCGGAVECDILGSHIGNETNIHIAVSPYIRDLIQNVKTRSDNLEVAIANGKKTIELKARKIEKLRKSLKKVSKIKEKIEIKKELAILEAEIIKDNENIFQQAKEFQDLETEIIELSDKEYPQTSRSVINVLSKVHPNVIVRIGKHHIEAVREELSPSKFHA